MFPSVPLTFVPSAGQTHSSCLGAFMLALTRRGQISEYGQSWLSNAANRRGQSVCVGLDATIRHDGPSPLQRLEGGAQQVIVDSFHSGKGHTCSSSQ